jgi:malate synthase
VERRLHTTPGPIRASRTATVRATVLIETIWAAHEMDEILFELRDHASGLNAGRWDYIFSMIKAFRDDPEFVLPDRAQVGMTVPFMRAYTELSGADLPSARCVRHRRHGGLHPQPAQPRGHREALRRWPRTSAARQQGCDGTWVAHPDLVPVAKAEFDAVLGDRPNQLDRQRPDVAIDGRRPLDTTIDGGTGHRDRPATNISVGIRIWQRGSSGQGAAGIDDLMEDAPPPRSADPRSGNGFATA